MSCLVYVHIKHGYMKIVRVATGKILYSTVDICTVEVKRPQNVRTLIPLGCCLHTQTFYTLIAMVLAKKALNKLENNYIKTLVETTPWVFCEHICVICWCQ